MRAAIATNPEPMVWAWRAGRLLDWLHMPLAFLVLIAGSFWLPAAAMFAALT